LWDQERVQVSLPIAKQSDAGKLSLLWFLS
jgi:hypothetical protein